MTDARDAVLGRVRDALADGPAPVAVPRAYERALPAHIDRVDRFAERVADYRATVERVSVDDLAAAIARRLDERGVRTLVVPSGIPAAWLTAVRAGLLTDEPPLTHDALDAADAVITTCAVAIAETGTIVLDGGAGQGRRVLSLLPDRHLCIVACERIVGTVSEALERSVPTRPSTWISGPSATSDIELQRVEGVHGPRILDVLIVDGRPLG